MDDGVGDVYFVSPGNIRMSYPAILYKLDDVQTRHADNNPYSQEKGWLVTVIHTDPDSPIPDRVAAMPKCRFDRQFEANGLFHTVYSLYF